MTNLTNDLAIKSKEKTEELIKKIMKAIPFLSEEATDNNLELASLALDSYVKKTKDEEFEWPKDIPISYANVEKVLTEDYKEMGYSKDSEKSIPMLRLRILRDRIRVEGTKRSLLWKFVDNFPKEDHIQFKKALDYADEAHAKQFRESGEPYITHPLAVSEIIMDMGLDHEAVIAGVLHDVVEDNEEILFEDIKREFSPQIALLVDGVTKLTKAGTAGKESNESRQAENVRKMFVAMAQDIRVIPIKLCDRLHNMRTLEYCHNEKRVRKAKETLEIYAPLAHRLGMGQVKSELEDLSFMHMDPSGYEEIKSQINDIQIDLASFINEAMEKIRLAMTESGIEGTVSGRPKHIYSIHRKMIRQNSGMEEVFDLMAVRIIVNSVADCYNVLGLVHSMWSPLIGRVKDYIATPKPNGYRSLHTTLIGDFARPFEVQIRTLEMHRNAEYGIAAHWKYKEGKNKSSTLDFVMTWMRQVFEGKNDGLDDGDDIIGILKIDYFSDYVFVYTPEGDLLDLINESTPVDFAYRIHSEVGNKCRGARVNGKIVTLDYKLQMGDIVEIITSNSEEGPKRDWLNFVKTQKARSKIKNWFKRELKDEYIDSGKDLLTQEVKKLGYTLSELVDEEKIPDMFKKLSVVTPDDIFAAVGYGSITVDQVVPKLIEEYEKKNSLELMRKKLDELQKRFDEKNKQSKTQDNSVLINGEPGMLTYIAKCCTPVPGDDIVGYITRGRGVSVHRSDCTNLKNISAGDVRLISAQWSGVAGKFPASVLIEAIERQALMFDIAQLFVTMNMSISGLNARLDESEMLSYISLSFEVKDGEHLAYVIKQLKKLDSVLEVTRIQS